MRPTFWLLGLLLAALALVLLAPHVAASSNCNTAGGPTTANVCQGWSQVSTTTGGVASTRCFSVRTTNSAPACATTTADESTWQVDPGGCITLYYFDTTTGGTPPAAPNKVTLQVVFDNTATAVKIFLANAAEPANGSSYSFCATSDGNSGSATRAGTYRIYLRLIKDNGAGGVGNYNIDSDGTASVGALTTFDKGALRAKMAVATVGINAYPAGSTFAYGTAADETMTVSSTFTTPNGDSNIETMRTGILDQATAMVGAVGSTVDVDAGSLSQGGYVADSTFPYASNPWQPYITIQGTAALTGLRWSVFATSGHGAGVAVFSDTAAYNSATFNIDPRINFDSDGTGSADDLWNVKLDTSSGATVSVFNRGETVWSSSYILNARGEQLTRAMTLAREDATPTTCASGSVTPTAGLYVITGVISTTPVCLGVATSSGSPHYYRATNTDQDHRTAASVYGVSTLYYLDAHLEDDGTLSTDDFPTEDANEDFAYLVQGDGMGGDASQTAHGWCHVKTVRKDVNIDTSGSAVTWTYKDSTAATRSTGTTDTDSTGWSPTSLNLLATTPLGSWTFTCVATFNGNTGTDVDSFTVDVPAGGGGDTFTGDPLKIFGGDSAIAGESVRLAVSEAFLDGTARTGNAAGTFIRILTPTNTLEVTDATPTEVSHGVYRYDWTPATTGPYVVLARTTDPDSGDPIGTANIVYVRAAATMTPGDNDTIENTTLALLLDKLGPQGDPVQIISETLDYWLPILIWTTALLLFLRAKKLLSAMVCSFGLVVALGAAVADVPLAAYALPLVLLVIALWMEATGKDHIIQDFFTPSSPKRREP